MSFDPNGGLPQSFFFGTSDAPFEVEGHARVRRMFGFPVNGDDAKTLEPDSNALKGQGRRIERV